MIRAQGVISKIWVQKVRARSHHSVIVIIINYSASAYKLDHKYDYMLGIKSGEARKAPFPEGACGCSPDFSLVRGKRLRCGK